MEKLTPQDEGCWFDCARGIYIGEAVIDEAISRGFELTEGREVDATVEGEFYHETWDDAECFLDSLAPEGYWVGSTENGDFGMWRIEEE